MLKPLVEAVLGLTNEVAGDLRKPKTDADVVATEGAIIELLVPPDKKGGNANSKAWTKKRAFTFDSTAKYAVVVYQAGTTDEVLLCGVFKAKPEKSHHPKKKASPKKRPHGDS